MHGKHLYEYAVIRVVPAVHREEFLNAGILLFSGSPYAMTLTGVTRLGIITPFGGLAFLAGWALLARAALGATSA